jgi:hypothetical protein
MARSYDKIVTAPRWRFLGLSRTLRTAFLESQRSATMHHGLTSISPTDRRGGAERRPARDHHHRRFRTGLMARMTLIRCSEAV